QDPSAPYHGCEGCPTGRGVQVAATEALGRVNATQARCGHCSACASDQMLRRIRPTAERTVTPVRHTSKRAPVDKRDAIRERLRVGKGYLNVAALVGAAMCSACWCGSHDRWP